MTSVFPFLPVPPAPPLLAQAPPTTGTTVEDVSDRVGAWVTDTSNNAALGAIAAWIVRYPMAILLVLLVAFAVNRLVRNAIKRGMTRLLEPQSDRTKRARRAVRNATPSMLLATGSHNLRTEARVATLTAVLRSLASVLIWFTAIVACLQILSVNLTSLIAISSIVGVALGFGAQNIVRDFLAGTFFVLEDQFGVGDTVDLGEGAKGTVEALTLRVTRIRDVNGTLWHVANGQVKLVANKSQEWARAVLDIEVDGATDYDTVAGVMQEVADAMSGEEQWMFDILGSPEVWGVESFTEKGYVVRLVMKTRPASQFGVMREVRIRLLDRFAEEHILLPGTQWATTRADTAATADPGAAGVDGGGEDRRVTAKATDKPVAADKTDRTDPKPPHPTRGDPGEAG